MKVEKEEMLVVNPHSAGIDVGSKSHYVAVGQGSSDVRQFNVYSSGLKNLVNYLKEHQIITVALEATGSYWQSLFRILVENGFEVLLAHGGQTKNLRGKTDVMDCQWIQKMHSLGLLRSCYLPGELTLKLRNLTRHRKSMIQDCSKHTNRMLKVLRLMNLRLDVAINDIVGVSGKRIINAILDGERDPNLLAQLVDPRVRKSKETIAEGLNGQYQEDLLFELKQNYDMFEFTQIQIKQCDEKIKLILDETTKYKSLPKDYKPVKKQIKGKNQPRIGLQESAKKLFGVDLFAISGVSVNTVLSFISEVGNDIYKFETSKQFVSWLRLAPKNKITGGKVFSSRTPKGKNALAIAFRDAANTVERLKDGDLLKFFKRIAYKKGRGAAITATARKIATIFWNMIVKKQEYNTEVNPISIEKITDKKVKTVNRLLNELKDHGKEYQLVTV